MGEENGKKIITSESVDERSVSPEVQLITIPARGLSIETELAEIEKNVEFFNRVKITALKMTKAEDWVDMGGPYMMDRGAESVAIAFGVDITEDAPKMEWAEDQKGRYYLFIATGRAHAKKLNRFVEDIGVCSQRDKFFGMIGGQFKEIPDVDISNIIRKASTNLHNRLIKRVVGLMGVTWNDLAAAGIKRESLAKVEYRAGGQKADKELSEEGKDLRTKLGDMLMRMANNDTKRAAELLEKYSTFKGTDGSEKKASSLAKMSEGWLKTTYGNAKKDYDKTIAGPREAGQEG